MRDTRCDLPLEVMRTAPEPAPSPVCAADAAAKRSLLPARKAALAAALRRISRRMWRGYAWRSLCCAILVSVLATAGAADRSGAAVSSTATRHSMAAPFDDGAPSIYGISGTFAAPCRSTLCQGAIAVARVARTGSAYLRVSVNLNCPGSVPQAPEPIRGNDATIGDLLGQAALYNLIPIVNLVPRGNCPDGIPLAPADWHDQLRYFVTVMHASSWYPVSRWIYFEIGNEPNLTPLRYGPSYPDDFRAAAQGVQAAMGSATKYRVLTAGMLQPTALVTCTTGLPYGSTRHSYTNLDMATGAINAAEAGPDPVPAAHLGVSVHPYKYTTPEVAAYWRNYYYWGNGYIGACFDLKNMIQTWTTAFPDLPLFFTESNWSDQPAAAIHCTNYVSCEGSYVVDLFTWLHDKGYDDPRTSHLRVTFFRGADADLSLGLFGARGNDKPFWTGYCPLDSAAAGWKSLVSVFTSLISSPCY